MQPARLPLVIGTVLALCLPGPASAEDWQPITTEAAYRAALAGHVLQAEGEATAYVSAPDGAVSGTVDGQSYTGNWTLRQGLVCYEGILEGTGYTYGCAAAFVTEDRLRLDWKPGPATLYYRIERADG